MTTNQNPASTEGQKHFPQNCGKLIATNNPSSLQNKERFTFKDCKGWNQYRQTRTTQWIRCDIDPDYPGCAALNIPDDPHPWNALRSVIEQFHKREVDIAWKLFEARKAVESTAKLEGRNKELETVYWKQDKRIGELQKEMVVMREIADLSLRRMQELEAELQHSTHTEEITDPQNHGAANNQSIALLNDLLQLSDPGEWVETMSDIIDCIVGLGCYEGNTVKGADIYFARRLQDFFMKLDKNMS